MRLSGNCVYIIKYQDGRLNMGDIYQEAMWKFRLFIPFQLLLSVCVCVCVHVGVLAHMCFGLLIYELSPHW